MAVPDQKPVSGCLTPSDSTLNGRQFDQVASGVRPVGVNVKTSGHYSQSPDVGRLYSIRVELSGDRHD